MYISEGPADMELNVGSAPARTSILSHAGLTLSDSSSEPPLVSDVMLEMCEGIGLCTCVHLHHIGFDACHHSYHIVANLHS